MCQYSPAAGDFPTSCIVSREHRKVKGYIKVPGYHLQSELAFQVASMIICARWTLLLLTSRQLFNLPSSPLLTLYTPGTSSKPLSQSRRWVPPNFPSWIVNSKPVLFLLLPFADVMTSLYTMLRDFIFQSRLYEVIAAGSWASTWVLSLREKRSIEELNASLCGDTQCMLWQHQNIIACRSYSGFPKNGRLAVVGKSNTYNPYLIFFYPRCLISTTVSSRSAKGIRL